MHNSQQVRTQQGCLIDTISSLLSLFEKTSISATSFTLPCGLLEDTVYYLQDGITYKMVTYHLELCLPSSVVNLPVQGMRGFRKFSFKTKIKLVKLQSCRLILFCMSEAESHNVTISLLCILSSKFLISQTYSFTHIGIPTLKEMKVNIQEGKRKKHIHLRIIIKLYILVLPW